jgi:predicted RNA polymerase sigma factor
VTPGRAAPGRPVAEDLLRELAPQVLGAVVRRYGDFNAAEDAVQEALLDATVQWPRQGTPDNPRGWLITVALRRMQDQVRSDVARRRREELAAARTPPGTEPDDSDDTLVLLFMCCHPALTPGSAIPLTLRAVGGLSTEAIARAFLVPEATMAQRISRAKRRIESSGVPFRMPTGSETAERRRLVLYVLYLMFNEGYTSSAGPDLARPDLSGEAIRLARMVHRNLPTDPEVSGLLALMLLTDARRPARTGAAGELIPLAEQDRALWDRDLIVEGTSVIETALSRGAVGPYQLQAAINALHDEAASTDETDWPQILVLYELLERMSPNPMVTLNRAVAVAMVHGPGAGLAVTATVSGPLADNHRLDAVTAHLHEMAGDRRAAVAAYTAAAARTTSIPERDYLRMKAARLADGLAGAPASDAGQQVSP